MSERCEGEGNHSPGECPWCDQTNFDAHAEYLAAWIRWPDGYWHCRNCHREVGTGHPPECPIAPLDFVAHD